MLIRRRELVASGGALPWDGQSWWELIGELVRKEGAGGGPSMVGSQQVGKQSTEEAVGGPQVVAAGRCELVLLGR